LDPVNGVQPYYILGSENVNRQSQESERDVFLKLLVTQMRYQDPLNPLEGTEFSAQLAQFSSLEQLQNMSGLLENAIEADILLARSINNTLAATIVGKSVTALCDQVHWDGSKKIDIDFELAGNAAQVEVEIVDADGNLMRTLNDNDLSKGRGSINWDGCDQKGNELPPGMYYVRIKATSPTDTAVSAQALVIGMVDGVRFVNGNPMLLVGEIEIPFGSVLEITNGEDNDSDGSNNPMTRILRWGR